MDITFDSDNPVTFRLVEGSGPVHVAAEHLVGMYLYIICPASVCAVCLRTVGYAPNKPSSAPRTAAWLCAMTGRAHYTAAIRQFHRFVSQIGLLLLLATLMFHRSCHPTCDVWPIYPAENIPLSVYILLDAVG